MTDKSSCKFGLERRPTSRLEPDDPRVSRTALLLVDVQKDFFSKSRQTLESFPHFEDNVKQLLKLCRSPKSPIKLIVHIRADYNSKSSPWLPFFELLNPDKLCVFSNEPEDFARCRNNDGDGPHEQVVLKSSYDGFQDTNLEQILTKFEVKTTFVCGLITSACVQATAHSAFARGFRPTLIEDCCADRKVELHEAVLAIYGGHMYKITDLNQLSKLLT